MFYGAGKTACDQKASPKNRYERYEQMNKQQELIEQKKREIEAKLESERHKKAMEVLLGPIPTGPSSASSPASSSTSSNKQSSDTERGPSLKTTATKANIFMNDGSFFEQFKRMQEQKAKQESDVIIKTEPALSNEYGDLSGDIPKPVVNVLNPAPTSYVQIKSEESEHQKRDVRIPPPVYYNDLQAPPPPPPPPPQPKGPLFVREEYRYSAAPPPPPPLPPIRSGFPSVHVKEFAEKVAKLGQEYEEGAKRDTNPILWFLNRPDSVEYRKYRELVQNLKQESGSERPFGFNNEQRQPYDPMNMLYQGQGPKRSQQGSSLTSSGDEEEDKSSLKRRRSRWGPDPQTDAPPPPPPQLATFHPAPLMPPLGGVPPPNMHPHSHMIGYPGIKQEPAINQVVNPGLGHVLPVFPGLDAKPRGPPPMLTRVTRTNPQLLSYARQSYGTTNLDDEQWKQCEEAYKMNLLFQDIARKKAKDEKLANLGKFKHEYDSDEEVDEDAGTWEHKQRLKEMEKTKDWAQDLTHAAKGKHHIGDFLPPEELSKFMDKYKAVKEGREMDESAYQDFKIAQDNTGFKLLQKMGWKEGEGLGSMGQGITAPIDKANTAGDKSGLGVEKPDELMEDDDEYAAYRKRMMLAYRFRPNPLNNPRRAYY